MPDDEVVVKRFASLSLFLLFASPSNGQTVAPYAKDYYVGVGEDASLEKARSLAYANMVEQIQVLVSSSFQTVTLNECLHYIQGH